MNHQNQDTPLSRLAEDAIPPRLDGSIHVAGPEPEPPEPASVDLHAKVTRTHLAFYTYPHRGPIGVVDLGPVDITVQSAESALEIAAAFTELAGRFYAAAAPVPPSPLGFDGEATGLASGPMPAAADAPFGTETDPS